MSDDLSRLPRVLLEGRPAARALLRGSDAHPRLLGEMLFYPWQGGTLVLTRAAGLPGDGFFALHIHARGSCRTGGDVAFLGAGDHFNPQGLPHPFHAGDLPVLLSSGGRAFSVAYTVPAGTGAGPGGGDSRPARRLPQPAHRRCRGAHRLRRDPPRLKTWSRVHRAAAPGFSCQGPADVVK